MLPDHELLAELPAPRDDEPSSLRRDIADELADHLACAFHRELVKSGDGETARERVLDHFGDPRRIARQLWFQAMWSRIMSQRIVLACSVTMAVAALAAVGLVGWMMQQQQLAAARQQQAMLTMMDRLTTVLGDREASSTGASADPFRDQVALKIRLVDAENPEKPFPGVSINIIPQPMKVGDASYSETTDAQGFADFAYLAIGRYQYSIHLPWGETATSKFTVHPGVEQVETIRLPAAPPPYGKVQFTSGLPDELRQRQIMLAGRLTLRSRSVGGLELATSGFPQTSEPAPITRGVNVVLTPDGNCWTTHFTASGTSLGMDGGMMGGTGGGGGGLGGMGGGGGFFSLPAETVHSSLTTGLFGQFSPQAPPPRWQDNAEMTLTSGEYDVHWTGYWEGRVPTDSDRDEMFGTLLNENWNLSQPHPQRMAVAAGESHPVTLTPSPEAIEYIAWELNWENPPAADNSVKP